MVLSPTRADPFRGTLSERGAHVTLGDSGELSLTVTIEDRSPAQGRRFAFRTMRQADCSARPWGDRGSDAARAFLVTDERPDSRAILDHADARSSAPFLAGTIAQTRPSPVLHNPPYREAAGAYRRSDGLGVAGPHLGFRSDKKV